MLKPAAFLCAGEEGEYLFRVERGGFKKRGVSWKRLKVLEGEYL